jgi:hypothetical protein
MEPKMKKTLISLAALAALSGAALAERSYDLRDSPESRGTFSVGGYSDTNVDSVNSLEALQQGDESNTRTYFGKYGSTTDPMEARRWDEKN